MLSIFFTMMPPVLLVGGSSDLERVSDYFMVSSFLGCRFLNSYVSRESSIGLASLRASRRLRIMARCALSPFIMRFLVSESTSKSNLRSD